MALYVHITEECRREAKRPGRLKELESLKEKVEREQSTAYFDNFPPPYLKKRFDRQVRLLAAFKNFQVGEEEHTVICFLGVFIRGGKEYRSFLDNPKEFGDTVLWPRAVDAKIESNLRDRLKSEPIPEREAPSEAESHFLYRLLGQDQARQADEFICESPSWVQKIGEERVQRQLSHLFDGLSNLLNVDPKTTKHEIRSLTVHYRCLPHLQKLFLAGIAENGDESAKIRNDYRDILESRNVESLDEEAILRRSGRLYPSLLLADEDAWFAIENDQEANLALSEEETKVLESAHKTDFGFPIFINGRAGSGKSTILYYLFADFVSLHLELGETDDYEASPPVLFSCSNDLRKRAHKTVSNLINCNPNWRQEAGERVELDESYFEEFHTFLLNLIPVEERANHFPVDRYVDYARFRELWRTDFAHAGRAGTDLDVDLAWHAIRTFIKGTNPEDYLEPEEYRHLPRKQRSVTEESFQRVYDEVWEGWYRPAHEEGGLWDDQDLARYVFAEGLIEPTYPAVFCDEAQDFTRVELELLFRLCLFSNRKLGYNDISRVPYAFAGDPFQTLNPTGFRWDAIQASFHEKLSDALGNFAGREVKLNYCELNLNYRSTRNVVRLCNLIQAMRSALFDIPDLRPQTTWQIEENSPIPVWFDRGDRQSWAPLQDESDMTIIVPCNINEEAAFIRENQDLAKVVKVDKDSGVPLNVLSVTRAKGLEFPRVVLFGFADAAPSDLRELLDQLPLDRDKILPFEYYVNQLYVATSRPKRRLFIIDSQQGRDQLWAIANDEELLNKIYAKVADGRKTWANEIGGFQVGASASWSEERGDPEENAIRFEKQGLAERDRFYLFSAAQAYESIGKTDKALLCRGMALRFEGKLIAAGEKFANAGAQAQALECFWEEGPAASEEILNLPRIFPDVSESLEFRLTSLRGEFGTAAFLKVLAEVRDRTSTSQEFRRRLAAEPSFRKFITEIVEAALEADGVDWSIVAERLQEIRDQGLNLPKSVLAKACFQSGDHRRAVAYWETDGRPLRNTQYEEAKSQILAQDFAEGTITVLPPEDGDILMRHFAARDDWPNMLRAARHASNSDEIIGLVIGHRKKSDGRIEREVFAELIEVLGARGEWAAIVAVGFAAFGSRMQEKTLRECQSTLMDNKLAFRDAMVAFCATSIEFAQQPSQIQRRYSDFFRKTVADPAQFRPNLTIRAVGAAMERAGRYSDILPFYERIFGDHGSDREEIEFARQRWICTKEKQVEREEGLNDTRAATKHRKEAGEKRRDWGLIGAKLPEFPEVPQVWAKKRSRPSKVARKSAKTPSIPPTPPQVAAPPKPGPSENPAETAPGGKDPTMPSSDPGDVSAERIDSTFAIGKLRLEYSPANGKLNVTHDETKDTASFRLRKRRFSSEDVEIEDSGDSVFSCPEWGIECDLSQLESEHRCIVRLPNRGLDLALVFQPSQSGDERT